MLRQSNPSICELIRIIFEESENRGKTHISQFRLLKILYLIKKKLSDNNPIKNDLNFYWYLYGPYSPAIVNNFHNMEEQSMIMQNSDNTYEFSQVLLKTQIISHDENLQEATEAVIPIVEEFKSTNHLRSKVYKSAPYSWYADYNEFMHRFSIYCEYVSSPEGEKHPKPYTNADVMDIFTDTLVTIPEGPEFHEFLFTYKAFSRMLTPLLEAGNPREYRDAYEALGLISEDIWSVFVSIVRVLHHDPYYDDQTTSWKNKYQKRLDMLNKTIKEAENTLEIPESFEDFDEETLKRINAPTNPKNVRTPDEFLKEIDEIMNS